VWILILITFVFQAVSYEFQSKAGNLLGKNTFRIFLTLNGCLAPLLIGTAVGTFFTGSDFTVNKSAVGDIASPVISRWGNEWHGLEAVANPFNVEFGLMVMSLAISLGALYLINNIDNQKLASQLRRSLSYSFGAFLVLFLVICYHLITMDGFAVNTSGVVTIEQGKYFTNLLEMPLVFALLLVGAVLLVSGVAMTLLRKEFKRGIWFAGPGTTLAVMALFMIVGYNNTAYYPSTADLSSSLTLANSSSSEFTLRTMAVVSLIIPFVVAYIAYFWRQMDKKSLTTEELNHSEKY